MTESSERGALYYHLNIILSLIVYIQLLSVWNQNVNIFSKVYYIHSVFLATCITVCTSRVADVPYILLLLGTPASVNTACRIGWLRSVTTQRIENNYFFNCFTRMTKRDIYISKIILTSRNQYIENFHRKFFSHGMGWDGTVPSHAEPWSAHSTWCDRPFAIAIMTTSQNETHRNRFRTFVVFQKKCRIFRDISRY